MSKTNKYQLPKSACLYCGAAPDAAASSDGKPSGPPSSGDLTVCSRCGAVMAFDANARLRGLNRAEMENLIANRQYVNYLATVIQRVRLMQAGKN